MGDRKNKSKGSGSSSDSGSGSGHLVFGAFRSASDPNLAKNKNPPPSGVITKPDSSSQSAQASAEQKPQQAAPTTPAPTPPAPTPTPSRSRRFFRRLRCCSSPPSPPPGVVDPHNIAADNHTAKPASHLLASSTTAPPRPHSSPSAQKSQGLLSTGGDATAVTIVPSFDHDSSSSPGVQGSPLASPLSAPVSSTPVSSTPVSSTPVSSTPVSTPIIREPIDIKSPCTVEPPTDPALTEPCSSSVSAPTNAPIPQVSSEPITSESPAPVKVDAHAAKLPTNPAPIEPPTCSSEVWDKTLELAKQKLNDNNLPLPDLTNLTLKSAEENMELVVKSLNTIKEDEQRRKWSYTWRGKKIVIAERLGEIIRSVGNYSAVLGTVSQCYPLVGALVWAGIQGIMQVALNHIEVIEGFEVAIAALVERMSICGFYSSIYNGVPLPSVSAANSQQLRNMLEFALPELYASVVVFSIKARTYFEAKGIKNLAKPLKSFNLEFQPFIEEINAKERAIREWADAATMERVKSIESVLQGITSDLKPLINLMNISTIRGLQDDRIQELLATLSPLEPLKSHEDIKFARAKYTGFWLLQLESFCKWQDGNITEDNNRVFCCYGIPGAGKTVICSIVIDYLYSQFHQHSTVGIACLYADYKDQKSQNLVNIFGSILYQLLTTTTEPIPDEVINKLEDIKRRRGKIGMEDCLALLEIQLHRLKYAYICIDALDELEPMVCRKLLNILMELCTSNINIQLFLTGRHYVESEIQKCFQGVRKYAVVISASQQDIEVFLRQQIMDDLYTEDGMDEELETDIIDTIVKKSQGMFLLPRLHIKMILEMTTISGRREALKSLPTDLNNSYEGIISRIRKRPKASAELGIQVLMWIHFARRPLKLVELQHALAVRESHTEFDPGNISSQKVLLDCCLGLVLVDEKALTVRFTHFTLEEYFGKNAGTEFPNGYSSIAKTCLTYLNFSGLKQHCTTYYSLSQKITKYVFLNYAALYWGTYYVKQQCADEIVKLARTILEHESEHPPCAIQALYPHISQWGFLAKRFSGIHVTAYFGLNERVVNFDKVELKDETDRTPLSWAAGNGHEGVVRLLLDRDSVDINSKDNEGNTPLMWATIGGHEAVVQLLVERDGVDINTEGIFQQKTPLVWAAEKGYVAIVRLLIEREGVELNAKGYSDGRTPLMFAAENGHEAVVRLLIERDGVDVNAESSGGMGKKTPLIYAVENGHEAVVRLLIEKGGVDLNAKSYIEGKTPLMSAAENGHEAVVRLLIERDEVDLNAMSYIGKWTPLILAAHKGHEAIVRLLIERDGVDINAKDNQGVTALMWAAGAGHEAVARLLVESDDVDINAEDREYGRTSLIMAAQLGHEGVVRLLTERDGVDINASDKYKQTPLMFAAKNGHEAVVRLLVVRDGIDINTKDIFEQKTPLIWAAEKGYEAIVRLLIESDGIDINASTNDKKTPLMFAAEKGHEAVVRLLVESDGIDINASDKYQQTPFMFAAENGHEAVVQLLVERDCLDINAKDNKGKTALMWAIIFRREAVVRLLLERDGVNINAKDNNGKTPFMYAVESGFGLDAVVRLLVERDGVNIDAKDNIGQTPLMWAIMNRHEDVVRLLIERDGVDINTKDISGRTPLMYAIIFRREAIVRLLVERDGVDINAKDDDGKTPLMFAAKEGHEAVVRLLVERDGVDIDAKDISGKTPLMCAVESGNEAVVRLLIERDGIDINAKDNEEKTPLICAAGNGYEAVVRLLVERGGVDIDATDNERMTALMHAAAGGHEAVAQLLQARGSDPSC